MFQKKKKKEKKIPYALLHHCTPLFIWASWLYLHVAVSNWSKLTHLDRCTQLIPPPVLRPPSPSSCSAHRLEWNPKQNKQNWSTHTAAYSVETPFLRFFISPFLMASLSYVLSHSSHLLSPQTAPIESSPKCFLYSHSQCREPISRLRSQLHRYEFGRSGVVFFSPWVWWGLDLLRWVGNWEVKFNWVLCFFVVLSSGRSVGVWLWVGSLVLFESESWFGVYPLNFFLIFLLFRV